ncbi:hypothetical protein T459_14442 [Capsicum annuum]|uniref:NAD-dependent epimerase/dehydratase domain-containing protein n=1 Tax=Capsicum annuum TaxID=4072 RepID=A0A2G2ZHE3_CAPAN|nr:hypothetical protein T459_14442 [Capsicum annuum]
MVNFLWLVVFVDFLLAIWYLQTIKKNVIGSINMLGLAKRVRAKYESASTVNPLLHPQEESYWGNVNLIGVRSCYDEGKRAVETLMFGYHRQHGIKRDNTGPINIENPGEFIMLELAENVKKLINPDVQIIIVENTPYDPRQRKPEITKVKTLLGWEPTVKLYDGIPLLEDDFHVRLGIPKKN